MVTYCEKCGSSLPFADVLIKNGKEITAPGYKCPDCGNIVPDFCDTTNLTGDDNQNNINASKKIIISNGEEEILDIEENKNTTQ